MMEVYIQYSGALCTLIKQILRCNSSIIEKAVATKHINGSMMPWGPTKRKYTSFTLEQSLGAGQGHIFRGQCRCPGSFGN